MNEAQFEVWPGDAPQVVVLRAEIPRDVFVEATLNLPDAREWVKKLSLLDCPTWEAQWDALEQLCDPLMTWTQEHGFEDFMHRLSLPERRTFSDLPLISKLIAAHAVETRPL